MIFIYNDETNPYFNLALEEYLLKNKEEEYFLLWRNENSIVVGKNQNTLSEVNLDYIQKNNMKIVRRLTGGGAVFHDLGNLNFTFIINDSKKSSFTDFKKFLKPVINTLKSLGIESEFSGRNDLLIDGKKISGNAQCKFKNRVLHHGTILFGVDMSNLKYALISKPLKFKDKGVKSVQSRVTNIKEYLNKPMTVLEFKDLILKEVCKEKEEFFIKDLTYYDLEEINKLKDEKYSTWQWNFGSSPKYNFSNECKFEGGTLEVKLQVNKGKIEEARIFGDFFEKRDISLLENSLIGVKHNEEDIKLALQKENINDYILDISLEEIIKTIVG